MLIIFPEMQSTGVPLGTEMNYRLQEVLFYILQVCLKWSLVSFPA